MAAGFKKATVNASSVAVTGSEGDNFPSYVDLSRIGITTLAEAQSVRVYADSGKSTEWAREIVSVTEMHVKIPSLTSTVEMYVDWDGSSADYAVTDTYGRNAVWSGYQAVYHLESLTTDYTGNSYTLTNTNSVASGVGKLGGGSGSAADFGATNTNKDLRYTAGNQGLAYTDSISLSTWVNITTAPGTDAYKSIFFKINNGNPGAELQVIYGKPGGTFKLRYQRSGSTSSSILYTTTLTTGTWYHIVYTYNGSTVKGYLNGAEVTSGSSSGGTNMTAATGYILGNYGVSNGSYMTGLEDESKVIGTVLSANWITTEYNNQNDEATFWGTWSDVGGGGANTTNFFAMMQ